MIPNTIHHGAAMKTRTIQISSVLALVLSGCGDASSLGVTQGGAQDMALAREIIESGGIPQAGSFTSEGLFSEHDLPLEGEACAQDLCPRAALAKIVPLDGGDSRMLVQLGFATGVDPDTFRRTPLNLSVAVDVSGSMSGDKLSAVKEALSAMVAQLDGDDRMSLVTYGTSAKLKKRSVQMDDGGRRSMLRAIGRMRTAGSTNMEAGMDLAYGQILDHAGQAGVSDRLMLFTDAMPNVGATDAGSFMELMQSHSEQGIGISVFGVGLDLGAELASEISKTRGGNSFFLADSDAISTVFDEDFDFVVSPIAYDLGVNLELGEGVGLEAAYGAPSASDDGFELSVSTLFLSRRNGGIGVMLDAEDLSGKLGTLEIRYETVGGETVEDSVHLQYIGGAHVSSTADADDLGVLKMAHLIDEFHALEAAAGFCSGELEGEAASVLVLEAQDRLAEASLLLSDEAIGEESMLMESLGDNLSEGSDACWPQELSYH
jgi:Ca-activated chloride channel homolog